MSNSLFGALTNSLGLGGTPSGGQTLTNNAQQAVPNGPGGYVYTTGHTAGQLANNANQMGMAGAMQGVGIQTHGYQSPLTPYGVMEETNKLLVELRDELMDMKKWLIQTYPDIYKQYVAVKEIERVSNEA